MAETVKRCSNVVLIGMPGAGKSTVGVILAKRVAMDFVDTDVLIQTHEGRTLQDIVDHEGYLELRRIEESVLLDIDQRNHVIATGGSAVYSEKAMAHLKTDAVVVYLDVTREVLEKRITNYATRGIAKHPDQTFEELLEERDTLYRQYADVTIDCNDLTQEQAAEVIVRRPG
jgi:shikimate kinase